MSQGFAFRYLRPRNWIRGPESLVPRIDLFIPRLRDLEPRKRVPPAPSGPVTPPPRPGPATGKRRGVDEMFLFSCLAPSRPVARNLDDELGGRAVLAAPPDPAPESHRRRRPSSARSAAARAASLPRPRSRAGRGAARPA